MISIYQSVDRNSALRDTRGSSRKYQTDSIDPARALQSTDSRHVILDMDSMVGHQIPVFLMTNILLYSDVRKPVEVSLDPADDLNLRKNQS